MSDFKYRRCDKCGNQEYRYANGQCEYCETEDLEGQDWPRCPHCFRPQEEWGEEFCGPGSGDGQEAEITCGHCEETFTSLMHVSYSFDSEKLTPTTPASNQKEEKE